MNDIDISLNRIPPHNIEAEKAVLGACLLDNKAVHGVLMHLDQNGEDFYRTANRIIFKTIIRLTENTPCDILILQDALRENNEIDKIGGELYLSEILDSTVSSANVEHYARIVREKAISRELIGAAHSIIEKAYSPNGNGLETLLEEAQKILFDITPTGKESRIKRAREVASQTFSVIETRYQQKTELIGSSTGLRDLDDVTCGLQKSELIILAGRPGMGKTALAMNIAGHAAMKHVPVAVFSLEMSAEALMLRMFAGISGIDARQLKRGLLSSDEWTSLGTAAGKIGSAPLFIDDSSALSPLELKAKARQLKHEHGIELLVIDYLQLMRGTVRHAVREQEIAEISRSLKAIARELNIPVVCCSQLNRQVENRSDKRPGLADLRESGAIEQDADVILFLYRDEVYNCHSIKKGTAEIHVGKQRNGPTGSRIQVQFQEDIQQFRDLSQKINGKDKY